jgi:hypothetical protein
VDGYGQDNLYEASMMLERLALILCMSAVLGTIEGIDTWHIACVYALVMAWGWVIEQEIYMAAIELARELKNNKDTEQ